MILPSMFFLFSLFVFILRCSLAMGYKCSDLRRFASLYPPKTTWRYATGRAFFMNCSDSYPSLLYSGYYSFFANSCVSLAHYLGSRSLASAGEIGYFFINSLALLVRLCQSWSLSGCKQNKNEYKNNKQKTKSKNPLTSYGCPWYS